MQTDRGAVRGTARDGGLAFLGIPYAAPPVGGLRFAAPQPHAAWQGVLDATRTGSACAQPAGPLSPLATDVEDCLFLNVYTQPAAQGLPVIVWIHGGSFTSGSGNEYIGTQLSAAGHLVVITINYRLGLLGFLASPALDSSGDSGNYGIEDQQAALRWVHANIAAFGGDPGNVTIAGESAGALSVCAQLASPGAAGLFAKAIAESGACAAPFLTRAQAEAMGQRIVTDSLGCAGDAAAVAACLRTLPVAKIEAAQLTLLDDLFVAPSVGGADLPGQPVRALGKVPLLLGGNTLEQGLFILQAVPTAATYDAEVRRIYGANAEAVLREYPVTDYASPFIALSTVESDDLPYPSIALCADLATATAQATTAAPVYLYEFADPNAPASFLTRPSGPLHTAELPYLWRDVARQRGLLLGVPLPPASQQLSDQMIGYWSRFAATGDPNGPGVP
ncbi:MAG TPA: carboxylesterase family protein, partial [Dehalococcoidia bacterium]